MRARPPGGRRASAPSRRPPVLGALALALALALPAAAQEPSALELPPRRGVLLGDEWRYSSRDHRLGLIALDALERFGADLVAIPANFFTTWTHDDYALLATAGGGVLALMVGADPLDAQLQRAVHAAFGLPGQRFTVWTTAGDVAVWATIGGAAVAAFLTGWFLRRDDLVELMVLMLEAFAVSEVFHLVPKLLLGRDSPTSAGGRAELHGPAGAARIFPGGTPSGHAASVYAMMGVASAWFDEPWLTAVLQAVGLVFCATLLVDDYHFASDLLWGATMGWELGQWVVRHRASQARPAGPALRVLPLLEPRTGTVAVSVGFSW